DDGDHRHHQDEPQHSGQRGHPLAVHGALLVVITSLDDDGGARGSRPPVVYENSASTNSSGSNSTRSAAVSPRPTSLIGMPRSVWMASAIPPLAVPSSLVSTTPVTSTASANCLAWTSPFWPVGASMTRRTSVTRPGGLSATRRTFFRSSIRLTLVWRRPAVSARTRSTSRAAARSTASKTTAPGSPPSLPRTNWAPTRFDHSSNCSAAAARNVSPAAMITLRPSADCHMPTLPIVVVLPTPLTP